jgi:hypothetical protein
MGIPDGFGMRGHSRWEPNTWTFQLIPVNNTVAGSFFNTPNWLEKYC